MFIVSKNGGILGGSIKLWTTARLIIPTTDFGVIQITEQVEASYGWREIPNRMQVLHQSYLSILLVGGKWIFCETKLKKNIEVWYSIGKWPHLA